MICIAAIAIKQTNDTKGMPSKAHFLVKTYRGKNNPNNRIYTI